MATTPRMTIPTQRVLAALLEDTARELYGLEIGEAAGLPSGTVHPILARLEGAGWLESRWEEVEPSAAGRPARRDYSFTPDGAQSARRALERAYRGRRVLGLRPARGT